MGSADVLILTALQDELEAVLALGDGGRGGWEERRDARGFVYHRRAFPSAHGGGLAVAAAWSGEMGERVAAIRAQQLLDELDPACLAMCGICAGHRGKVGLGDVIVADQLYGHDEGKVIAAQGAEPEVLHSLRTFDLEATWKMDAAFLARALDVTALSAARPPSKAAQRRWLLEALYAHAHEGGPAPATHPDRRRACPGWTERLRELLAEGLVVAPAGKLALEDKGREAVLFERTLHPDGLADDPPFRIHVGAIATGKAVQEDPKLFDRLRHLVRTTCGVEMEGAAIGEVAARFKKRAIVVKAVSDHADHEKDDSYRAFACRASAEVLLAFLQKHLEPERRPEARDVEGEPRDDLRGPLGSRRIDARSDGFLVKVDRVTLLREPGAIAVRHAAPPPFAGVLEIAVREGALVDVQVVGALEQPVTEELVAQYAAQVERRFRQENPSVVSTLVHGGPQASIELARSARRRGIVLKSFGTYQGLIDFRGYLARQTDRLEADTVYPPWLYVEQPAKWSLAGGREEQATESALRTLWDLLDDPHPRFALVLGDFGAGKTFLLHELARRMNKEGHPLVPVLVEMSRLEKQRSLKALLAQHFALADVGRIDLDAFQYMLSEGRIALLFDGFDELALRVTYDRAVEHFETVMAAAQGNAKVVVTSRTQHFLTDHQVRRAMAERAEQVPGYRLFTLEKFGEAQIRRFLGNLIEEPAQAEERYRLLDEVKDLLGLAENPRMLGFIAKIEPQKLREAKEKSGEITAAKLYEILVDQWLGFEHDRANPPGAPKGISREKLRELVDALAALFWVRKARALAIGEMREVLSAEGIEPAVVEHMVGSGSLLVRDGEGRFSFVHRSVMEWLVAAGAAREVGEKGDAAALGADEMSELMADFFVSLAGREDAERWAYDRGGRAADGHAKKNATRVLRRIAVVAAAQGGGDVEVPITLDLEGQDLRGQDYSCADLRGANLARADLGGATLVEARLAGASLVRARLVRANLWGADLTGADLARADLSFARLLGADLRGVRHLAEARVRGAVLVGAEGVTADAIECLTAAGAAAPVPAEVEPVWAAPAACKSVTWSPSGDLLASGHEDGTVRLWDAISGQALRTLSGHTGVVLSVAFSPDGVTLASGSDDKTVRLWEVARGRALSTFEEHTSRVTSVAFTANGMLVSGSDDNTVRLWDVGQGHAFMISSEDKGLIISSVAISPDGGTLALGSRDGTVGLGLLAQERIVRTFVGHNGVVQSVVFSPDGKTLASGSSDNTVRVWDVASGRNLHTFKGHANGPSIVAFSPDGQILASGSHDDTVRLWDVATGSALHALSAHTREVTTVAFSPDGKLLASGSLDQTMRLWEVATGRCVRVLARHESRALSVVFSPDGRRLASGSDDSRVSIWKIPTVHSRRTFKHAGWARGVAWSPDSRLIASACQDTMIRLWDVATGHMIRSFDGHVMAALCVAFGPDGQRLATGSDDGTARIWDVSTGDTVQLLLGHGSGVRSVAFSPDGLSLASGSYDKTVRLWDVASGRLLGSLKEHTDLVLSVAWSPDGRALASGSGRTVRLWNLATERPVLALDGHASSVQSVAFSRNGDLLASGSEDTTILLWSIQSGLRLRAFTGHTKWVRSVAFSPDGQTLASASDDGTIRLWDVATARCLAVLLAAPEGWAAFTPDGRYKIGGDIAGSFWHVVGLCRFEPGELDPYLPDLRLPDDASFLTLPPPKRPGP